jgi:hypothetical protein
LENRLKATQALGRAWQAAQQALLLEFASSDNDPKVLKLGDEKQLLSGLKSDDELKQRLADQAKELKELKEMFSRRDTSRREASRRGSSGHPLSVMSPSPASKRARDAAPERSRRTHSEQEETFSDDDDSLSEVRGDIRERANRLSRGQEGALANLNDDPNFGEYESEEESDGESIAGSDVDDAEGGDGSLAKHAMSSVVLEKMLIHDQECRDLSATPYRHRAGFDKFESAVYSTTPVS